VQPTSIRSWGSIALGGIFASGTAASIFWDVRSLGDITPDHMMTALVLIGTIASGHMFWRQARSFNGLACVGLAVLFCCGTFYCVTTSASRNVEVGIPKTLAVLNLNQQRRDLERDIAEAKEDARKAKAAALKDCATGDGARCRSLTKLADAADSHYWMLLARLANTQPEQPANPGLHHAAEVFAALPLAGSAASIERGLVLFSPFVKALFLEIATVVFMGIGLSGREQRPKREAEAPLEQKEPFQFHRRTLEPLSTDAATVVRALQTVRRPVSNDELAALMSVTKGEASRRATIALENGLIVRQRLGREVAISLAKQKLN